MPSLREQKKIEKRMRILEAAIKVFAKHGFHGTTVSQIATEANVADGTIYLYFSSKDELLVTIFEEMMDRFITQGVEVIAAFPTAREKLAAIAELHLTNLGANEDLATVFQVELRHSIHVMKKFSQSKLREYFRLVEEVIEFGQQGGEIREDLDAWTAVKILYGALDEMATNWILREKEYALVSTAKPTIDILLNGMAAS